MPPAVKMREYRDDFWGLHPFFYQEIPFSHGVVGSPFFKHTFFFSSCFFTTLSSKQVLLIAYMPGVLTLSLRSLNE
jgi:hypothetical protein